MKQGALCQTADPAHSLKVPVQFSRKRPSRPAA